MASVVKQPISEWDALQTWAKQSEPGFLRVESERLTLTDKPIWLGRAWEALRSFLGFSTLESVARKAIALATKAGSLSNNQKDALNILSKKIEKFNSRSQWLHPRKIPSEILKVLAQVSVSEQGAKKDSTETSQVEDKRQKPQPETHSLHKKVLPTKPHKRARSPHVAQKPKAHPSPVKAQTIPHKAASRVTKKKLAKAKKIDNEKPQLIGKMYSKISELYSGSEDQDATKLIDPHFTACRVIGDGHCMFRSMAVALLDRYTKNSVALLAMVRRCSAAMTQGPYSLPKSCSEDLEKSCTLLQQGTSVQEIMNTPALSNSWVQFLRYIAAANILSRDKDSLSETVPHMARDLGDRALSDKFSEHTLELDKIKRGQKDLSNLANALRSIEKIQDEIVDHYLATKTDMSGKNPARTYGTALELVSLSRALGLRITSIDFNLSLANREFAHNSFPDNTFSSTDAPPDGDIFLSFRGDHYNSLFRNK